MPTRCARWRRGAAPLQVIESVERARESVRRREAMRKQRIDTAESAAQWLLSYARRLKAVSDALASVPPGSTRAQRLREQQAELERKHAWREQQRAHALQEGERAKVSLRYREIAAIVNMPVGSVSAQISRLRQELVEMVARDAGARRSASPESSS